MLSTINNQPVSASVTAAIHHILLALYILVQSVHMGSWMQACGSRLCVFFSLVLSSMPSTSVDSHLFSLPLCWLLSMPLLQSMLCNRLPVLTRHSCSRCCHSLQSTASGVGLLIALNSSTWYLFPWTSHLVLTDSASFKRWYQSVLCTISYSRFCGSVRWECSVRSCTVFLGGNTSFNVTSLYR
jgi:hypothetical protein